MADTPTSAPSASVVTNPSWERVQLARHPKLTPLAAVAAFGAALTGAKELPLHHTLDYDVEFKFANGQTVLVSNSAVDVEATDLLQEWTLPMAAAAENPFAQVMLQGISGTVRVTPRAGEATILSVSLPRSKFQPGETAKLYVTYRPFWGTEAIVPLQFELPRDLPDGIYPLSVDDWTTYIADEEQIHPFRFTADSESGAPQIVEPVKA